MGLKVYPEYSDVIEKYQNPTAKSPASSVNLWFATIELTLSFAFAIALVLWNRAPEIVNWKEEENSSFVVVKRGQTSDVTPRGNVEAHR